MTHRPARARTGPNDSTLAVVCQKLPRTATSLRRSRREVAQLRGPRWPQMAKNGHQANDGIGNHAGSGDHAATVVLDGPFTRTDLAARSGTLRPAALVLGRILNQRAETTVRGAAWSACLGVAGVVRTSSQTNVVSDTSIAVQASGRVAQILLANTTELQETISATECDQPTTISEVTRSRQSEWDHHEQRHGRRDRSSGPRKPSGLPRNGHGWRRTFTACSPCSQWWPSSWQYRALMASGAGKPTRDLGHV